MKICVPSKGKDPSSEVDDRFARAEFFAIYDTDSGEYEFVENTIAGAHGAGPKVVQFLASKGVNVVIAYNVGMNAYSVIQESGISVYLAKGGTVEENVKAYLDGELKEFGGPTR